MNFTRIGQIVFTYWTVIMIKDKYQRKNGCDTCGFNDPRLL